MKSKKFFLLLTISPLIIGVLLLFFPFQQPMQIVGNASKTDIDSTGIEPEKLVFLLQYLGTDYGVAVDGGEVVSEFEYQEMLDFSQIVVEEYRKIDSQGSIFSELVRLRQIILNKEEWDAVRGLTRNLIPQLSQQLGIVSHPVIVPNLSRGQEIFVRDCSKCHGLNGDGKGPSVEEDWDPAPRSFRDSRMNQLAPYQIFNAVTFGVEGTEMPSHMESLSSQESWDIAFYIMTFREDFNPRPPQNPISFSLNDLSTHSTEELISRAGDSGFEISTSEVDYYRNNPPGASFGDLLQIVQQKVKQSFKAYQQGDRERAFRLVLDAYLEGVEPIEPALQQRDRQLALELERQFFIYRGALQSGVSEAEVSNGYQPLEGLLNRAHQSLKDSETISSVVFFQSLAIILREGLEAFMLIGLMMTCLIAAGQLWLRKYLFFGVVSGIVLGGITWFATQMIFNVSSLQQEVLEGLTSLVAAGVLFWVSFWIIHQLDVEYWKEYMKKKTERAIGAGSGLVLALAAFFAVYREAVETVLFYQALWIRSNTSGGAIIAGFISGILLLILLMLCILKFGLRIPLKQFFVITGIILGMLTCVFAGYGVRELQIIGWIKETPLLWMVQIDFLEIHPTLEGCALQIGILLSFLLGWIQSSRLGRSLVSSDQ